MSSGLQYHSSLDVSSTVPQRERKRSKRNERNKKQAVLLPPLAEASCTEGSFSGVENRNFKQQLNARIEWQVKSKLNNRKVKNSLKKSGQSPDILHGSQPQKKGASNNRVPSLTRKDILQNKILCNELAARLAEAKQSLSYQDPVKNEHTTPGAQNAARESGLSQPSNRVSFQTVGRRVANIIRFRQAAQPRGFAGDRISSGEAYDSLPKTPRFSSYMSAAAQYALMKGYEDIIFEKLSSSFPECNGLLKRNKTPHHSVAISEMSRAGPMKIVSQELNGDPSILEDELYGVSIRNGGMDAEDKNQKVEQKGEDYHFTKRELKMAEGNSMGRHTNETSMTLENQSSPKSPFITKSSPSFLENLGKISLPPSESSSKNNDKMKNSQKNEIHDIYVSWSLQNAGNSGRLAPLHRDRRIVLSHRMEDAMDILDTMKTKSEHALSPRIKLHPRSHFVPLVDFNRWADQWATEFNTDAVK